MVHVHVVGNGMYLSLGVALVPFPLSASLSNAGGIVNALVSFIVAYYTHDSPIHALLFWLHSPINVSSVTVLRHSVMKQKRFPFHIGQLAQDGQCPLMQISGRFMLVAHPFFMSFFQRCDNRQTMDGQWDEWEQCWWFASLYTVLDMTVGSFRLQWTCRG